MSESPQKPVQPRTTSAEHLTARNAGAEDDTLERSKSQGAPLEQSRWRRRDPRGNAGGAALAARGEPMVWLTGGALVIALLMISGLLLLILTNGIGTFWPRPIVQLELQTPSSTPGSSSAPIVMGEPSRTEKLPLTRDLIAAMPGDAAGLATKFLGEREQRPISREQLRTGNFDLTGKHFQWIHEFEVAEGGRRFPHWAILVERMENGRFYGEPVAFLTEFRRPISGDEERFAAILSVLGAQQSTLTGDDRATFLKMAEILKAKTNEARRNSSATFVKKFRDDATFSRQNLFVVPTSKSGETVEKTPENSPASTTASVTPTKPERANSTNSSGMAVAKSTANTKTVAPTVPSPTSPVGLANAGSGTIPLDDLPKGDSVTAVIYQYDGAEAAWERYVERHPQSVALRHRKWLLTKHDLGAINRRMEHSRLMLKNAQLETGANQLEDLVKESRELDRLRDAEKKSLALADQIAGLVETLFEEPSARDLARRMARRLGEQSRTRLAELERRGAGISARIEDLPDAAKSAVRSTLEVDTEAAAQTSQTLAEVGQIQQELIRDKLRMRISDGREADLALGEIVRAYPANQLSTGEKFGIYFSRWREFLTEEPREANSEGGVFPAIWGTVAMTLIMSLFVTPFGVLAALYLREYARPGLFVSAVRISINNLAGVPSIVFGVFGLGFFSYVMGAYIDGGPRHANFTPWPAGAWLAWLGVLALVAVVAFVLGLVSMTSRRAETARWKIWCGRLSVTGWIVASGLFLLLLAKTPFFDGFYRASLPADPTFGKGGLLWASLTLALLTLPVVIVATEEALASVPNSMREGSYACGASKWQTIWRIVLPRALPGIMTGMILAMARGAGEVAPLMLVGAKKIASDLPIDTIPPYVHADRSFMHLGFHIFDLGFQSQNSIAAQDLVFTTTLLLICLIATLNLSAIWLRGRLRRKFSGSQF